MAAFPGPRSPPEEASREEAPPPPKKAAAPLPLKSKRLMHAVCKLNIVQQCVMGIIWLLLLLLLIWLLLVIWPNYFISSSFGLEARVLLGC